MSNITVFPVNDATVYNAIYEQARADAKARVQRQWSTENFNRWTTYNTVINPDWEDPYFEHELGGIYNGPSTGPNDPAYEMTQNFYYIYNWLKYKGWHNYAICAFAAGTIQSSTMTGGLWEEMVSPYNAVGYPNSWIGWNAASQAGNSSREWYKQGVLAPAWTATAQDEEQGTQVSLTAAAGSWAALRKLPIKMDTAALPIQVPVYPLRFDYDGQSAAGGYTHSVVGYGLVQWSNFNRLITKAALCTTDGEGGRHWQLNLTLQLMVMEFERQQAMQPGVNQYDPSYLGEWTDAAATSAYITKEINGQQVNIHYPQSCTWDFWKADNPLQVFSQHVYSTYGIGLTDWDLRHIMMDIFRVCYIHTSYVDFDFETKTLYLMHAIQYWDSHGGWTVKDIPRPRDLTECELDQYHVSTKMLLLMVAGRRKKRSERTILL